MQEERRGSATGSLAGMQISRSHAPAGGMPGRTTVGLCARPSAFAPGPCLSVPIRRRIFLDTETTGLSHRQGHRVIEIGGVEEAPAGRRFHRYLNPDRGIDAGAFAVHGITRQSLRDKPRFADVASEFLDFIRGAELVIHNARFDVGFLNAELALLDEAPVETVCRTVTDSLLLARAIHPGEKNSLDALCERYGVDNSKRTLHGALLDAEILAEVYAAMMRGGRK